MSRIRSNRAKLVVSVFLVMFSPWTIPLDMNEWGGRTVQAPSMPECAGHEDVDKSLK